MNLLLTLAAMLQWGAIDLDQSLTLQTNVTLNPLRGQTASISLKKGTKLIVKDVIPLDSIRVLSYKLEISPCPAALKDKKSDMTIVDELYGVELSPGCVVDTFIELRDLNVESPFSLNEKR